MKSKSVATWRPRWLYLGKCTSRSTNSAFWEILLQDTWSPMWSGTPSCMKRVESRYCFCFNCRITKTSSISAYLEETNHRSILGISFVKVRADNKSCSIATPYCAFGELIRIYRHIYETSLIPNRAGVWITPLRGQRAAHLRTLYGAQNPSIQISLISNSNFCLWLDKSQNFNKEIRRKLLFRNSSTLKIKRNAR